MATGVEVVVVELSRPEYLLVEGERVTKHTINIQDGYLFQCLKTSQLVHCDLVNGRSLEGKIKRFDRFAVILDRGGEEILIYKHAISTIASAPAKA